MAEVTNMIFSTTPEGRTDDTLGYKMVDLRFDDDI